MCAGPRYTADMTIEDYLYGCVGYAVSENTVTTILVDRGVEPSSSVLAMSKKQRDLCKADLYMSIIASPSVSGNVEDSNGVWKHKEGGTQVTASDKKHLRSMANAIYKLYGESTVNTGIRISSFGMKLSK